MRMNSWVRSALVVFLSLASLGLAACNTTEGSGELASAPETQTPLSGEPARAACIDTDGATRDSIAGTPVWARFCPGPEGHTAPAEVPSDALTTHASHAP